MKMRKVLLVCIVLLLVFGCAPGKKKDDTYRYGDKGLTLEFVPNTLPSKIYGDDNINVIVKVMNEGAATIARGKLKIYISGFDASIISGVAKENILRELSGRSMYDPVGDFDVVEFTGKVSLAGKEVDTYSPTFLVTACYEYQTVASAPVCIDKDPFSVSQIEKTCTPVDIKLSGGQGAPIAVTGIDVSAMKGKTRFIIRIENIGKGTPYDKESSGCSPYSAGLGYNEVGVLNVDDVLLSGRSIKSTCKPLDNSEVRLVDGKRAIFCEYDATNADASAYTSPLTMKLSYGYRESITKGVEVIKSP